MVAVVVVGPALTVLVAVVAVVAEAVALVVELAELEESLEPPQAAITKAASTAAQSARRGIGAL